MAKSHDRVLVFDKPGVLPRLAHGKPGLHRGGGEPGCRARFGPLATTMHTIVVYPRNAANADPHVVLDPLNYEAFRAGIEGTMGLDRDDCRSSRTNRVGR